MALVVGRPATCGFFLENQAPISVKWVARLFLGVPPPFFGGFKGKPQYWTFEGTPKKGHT